MARFEERGPSPVVTAKPSSIPPRKPATVAKPTVRTSSKKPPSPAPAKQGADKVGRTALAETLAKNRKTIDSITSDIADVSSEVNDTIARANIPSVKPDDVIPGSTGGVIGAPDRTLASDTFANTFAVMFGRQEANQAYVKQLYDIVSGYYKSGSSIDEALNLAVHDAYDGGKIPEFTKRFSGLFALQKQERSGVAVQVPTVAEYIASENAMGDALRSAGMGELATQDYLGQVIGKGKSVADVANTLSKAFMAIDSAPQEIKDVLSTQFPMLDRVSLAKALVLGPDGVADLQKKIQFASTKAASTKQGLSIDDKALQSISDQGFSYDQSLQRFAAVATEAPVGQKLTDIYGKTVEGYDQTKALQDNFLGLASAQRAKLQLIQREQGTFSGSSGTLRDSYGTPRSSFNTKAAGQV